MSLAFNTDYCLSHWEAIEEGAKKAGRMPSRKEWRLVRDVYVADTDEEARAAAVGGMTARVWRITCSTSSGSSTSSMSSKRPGGTGRSGYSRVHG